MKQDPNLFDAFLRVDSKKAAVEPVASRVGGQRSPTWLLGGAGGALLAMVFFAGYFLGGGGNREALANEISNSTGGGKKPDSGLSDQSPSGPEWVKNEGARPSDPPIGDFSPVSSRSGLYNEENRFTVLAITYTDQLTFEKRALEVAEYLREQGLPAFDPVANGKRIEILVGAAPTRGELSMVASRLRGTKGPNGRSYDFESAIVDNIDNHIDR